MCGVTSSQNLLRFLYTHVSNTQQQFSFEAKNVGEDRIYCRGDREIEKNTLLLSTKSHIYIYIVYFILVRV